MREKPHIDDVVSEFLDRVFANPDYFLQPEREAQDANAS